MKIPKSALVFAVLASGGAMADATPRTTIGDLAHACQVHEAAKQSGVPPSLESGYCIGYIVGVIDGSALTAAFGAAGEGSEATWSDTQSAWCMPESVGAHQYLAVFNKWASEHPELWHEPRIVGVATAFREAWPCVR
jgi:hypothetical protein